MFTEAKIAELLAVCESPDAETVIAACADPDTGYVAALEMLREAREILLDVWMRFSVESTVRGKPRRTDGGLSTLTDVAEFLGIEQ